MSGSGIEAIKPRVYGCRGAANSSSTGACSATRPAYITSTSLQSSATTPRSCVMNIIAMPCSCCSFRRSSRICACTVTSSAVVGSSAIKHLRAARERHRDHDALAHAARELMRILLEPLHRRGNADLLEQLDGALVEQCSLGARVVQAQRLDKLTPHAVHGVQRRHRFLEDHADAAAANVAHLIRREAREIVTGEQDAAALDDAGRPRQQAHDGERASPSCRSPIRRRRRVSRPVRARS